MTSILKNKKAFTLIEVVVVVGIVSVLLLMGIPALLEMSENNQLKGTARNLYSFFQKAKLEAIRRNANVVISITPGAYSPQGGVGSYKVFVDDSENFVHDGGEELIDEIFMPTKISLVSANFSGATAAGFTGRGLPANSRFGNAQIRNDGRWYKITLNISGTVSINISQDGVTWN